jgi:hypothetical protein
MDSELGAVLREQQALLSRLLNRVALADGKKRSTALDAFACALNAHLGQCQSVLLPMAGDSVLVRQVSASVCLMAQAMASARLAQRTVGVSHDIQTLIRSLLSLLSQENRLLGTALGELPGSVQQSLAYRAEQEFVRLGGLGAPDEHWLDELVH